MRRVVISVLAVVAVVAANAAPAGAISGRQLDGNLHPNVAMIVFYQPDGRFRCSATLVSTTVLVTAAHCTEGVRGKSTVTFEPVSPTSHARQTTPATGSRRPDTRRQSPAF